MRITAVITASLTLSLVAGAAAASPFSLTASSESETAERESERRGFVQSLFNATAALLGFAETTASAEEPESFANRFFKQEERCAGAETAEDETDDKDAEKTRVAGPEPIYFGF